ncbi:hypothetical protein I316_06824 [Kwoniella heveanensis BCC8398]|uniref:Major facilitator superfamily (MFS) profile domain-containing protein n=1 Tax=Kwoniella heveanensis BCC8398 TaxID=1296120 RepID=A0A1B9GJZ4_9TREE|nr:hypothetical protein I316_06824 [Kwoniella heveanensis BCC8398]
MGILNVLEKSPLHRYAIEMKGMPSAVLSFQLLLTVFCYAISGAPRGFDEGVIASISQLKSFTKAFALTSSSATASASVANKISNMVSLVSLGCGIGPILSLPLNDVLGRRNSVRLWQLVNAAGLVIEITSGGRFSQLYAGRIIAGCGIGALTVIGPLSLSETAPRPIRGLIAFTFNMCMIGAQVLGIFIVYGVQKHMKASDIQWQLPLILMLMPVVIALALSFFISESPRWLVSRGKEEEALRTLCKLRRLPADHPFVQDEYQSIVTAYEEERLALGESSLFQRIWECFSVRSNWRRMRTVIIAYLLAQFSGSNSITNYLPTILGYIGQNSADDKLLYTAGNSLVKLSSVILASFFLIDALGRRKSFLTGVIIQGLCHTYLAIYINRSVTTHNVTEGSSKMALAAIYLQSLGWGMGLLPLPYLFGAELFPTRIRAVGGAIAAAWHWLFFFAMVKATPSLLTSTNTWGAFAFFAVWCAIAWVYGFLMVPETSGRSLENIQKLFELKWYEVRKHAYPTDEEVMIVAIPHDADKPEVEHIDGKLADDLDHEEHQHKVQSRV